MGWFAQIRGVTRDELHEEMESHVFEKAEALVAEGMSYEEALTAARRTFGNQALIRDRAWEEASNPFLDAIQTDLRFALRQLRRSFAYTCSVVMILGIGIGANTAVFTVLYQALFRTLPVTNPKQLVLVQLHGPKLLNSGAGLTLRMYEELQSRQKSFGEISGWVQHDRVMAKDAEGRTRSMNATLVTGNGFDTLGIDAQLGRLLTSDDDKDPHPAIWPVVLSDRFWNERYQRDPKAIGQTIEVADESARIVGITPAGFEGITPNNEPQMFLPLRFLNAQKIGGVDDLLAQDDTFRLTVIARLKEGQSLSSANKEIESLSGEIAGSEITPVLSRHPMLTGAHLHVTDGSRGLTILDQYRDPLTTVQILMVCGLLFCCANVSGLQTARRLERAHEFALRIALGASRKHLVRPSLAEALITAFAGALVAVPITYLASHYLGYFLTVPGAGDITNVRPDWHVFTFAGGFALICVFGVALVPVVFAKNVQPVDVLHAKMSSKPNSIGTSRILLIAQVTATFLLLAAALYSWRTLHELYDEDLGYDPKHVTEVSAQFQELQKTPEEIMTIYRRMLSALNENKDIPSATYTWVTQLTTFGPRINVALPGSQEIRQISFNAVGPKYFATLRTPLLEGREFTSEDHDTSQCIVNDLVSTALFHSSSSDVIGRRIQISYYNEINTTCRVIGIVAATKFADIHQPKMPILFLPISSAFIYRGGYNSNMVFLIRGVDEGKEDEAYLKVLSEMAPGTGYQRFLPMERQLQDALGSERLQFYLSFFFGAVALTLCGIATWTLLMMRVQQNLPQIAIRVALGASPWKAAGIVLQEMAFVTIASVTIGALCLEALAYVKGSSLSLHGFLSANVLLMDICLVILMMLCAGGLPAIRAGTLHPMQVLCRDA